MFPNNGTPEPTAGLQTSASIEAAAHAYKVAMDENSANEVRSAPSLSQPLDHLGDVVMTDGIPNTASPAIIPPPILPGDSPAPQRIGTPLRVANGDATSRATSQHPEPAPPAAQAFPKQATLHGAPTRQYVNGKVTTSLLEGMKLLAKDQPKDPLRVLGEYLLQKSRELEGT